MDYYILVPVAVLFAGSILSCLNTWMMSRTMDRLFRRLDTADEFIRASANTQAYLTVEERNAPKLDVADAKTIYNRVIE